MKLPLVAGNVHESGNSKSKRSLEGKLAHMAAPKTKRRAKRDYGDGPMDELACDILKALPGSDGDCSRSEREGGTYLHHLTLQHLLNNGHRKA